MERIDRFLGNSSWFNAFPNFQVTSFFQARSDHCPILLDYSPSSAIRSKASMNLFRYKKCWDDNPEVSFWIKEIWSNTTIVKIREIGHFLESWQTNQRIKLNELINQLTNFINMCLKRQLSDVDINNFIYVKNELYSLLNAKEIYWAQ